MTHSDAGVGILEFLQHSGLVAPFTNPDFERLSGGVSSDIWIVRTGDRIFCVKRALPQLRVAAEWKAPVSRNANEVKWLTHVARFNPTIVYTLSLHDALPIWKSVV